MRDDSNDGGDGFTLSGHAAVFNQTTEIDSWEGRFLEQIAPGAFRKTIRERTPVLQFDHGHHPLVGSIPIGSITDLREDDEGLAVTARLSDNWLIEPVRMAIKERNVTGMSFRFEVVREEWRDASGKLVRNDELLGLLWEAGDRGPITRTLKELKVAELGPVVFPAYRGTDVDVRAKGIAELIRGQQQFVFELRSALAQSVRPKLQDLETLSDPELRRNVATALLFKDAPVSNHPSSEQPTDSNTESNEVTPSDSGHLTEIRDAPTDEGHPSNVSESRDYMRAKLARFNETLGSVKKG